jgi:energy-converting hydrogenase Eha subunit C
MSRTRPITAIFAWPLVIFAIGLAGLVIALTGDGWRDVAAWAALAAPVAAAIWAMAKRRK